jgi:hypothetical protein
MDRMLRAEIPARGGRPLRVFNGGSVGLPYNGDPRAHYLILDLKQGVWEPHFRRVPFDRTGLREAFASSGMLAAVGPTGELHVRTAVTGEPWSSDFAYWLHQQGLGEEGVDRSLNMEQAVATYLERHGPGRWAFTGEGL